MEKIMKQELYSNLKKMSVEEYQLFLQEAENKYIKINKHPENEDIIILNYTDLVTYERRWNEQTMKARGLILDVSKVEENGIVYILAEPFEKFFNYGENAEYEEGIENWQVVSIMEKMDGSLGISYYFQGEIRFATRGSFISEQAVRATKIWKEKYEKNYNYQLDLQLPITYLVEIIYPENRVVVDYGDREELVLLGARYIGNKYTSFVDSDYQHLKMEAKQLGMNLAKEYKYTLEDILSMKSRIDANKEGWVVKFHNGKRLKVKGDEYIGVHRIVHGLSVKAKYKAWAEGNLEQYIMRLPEEFRDELEEFQDFVEALKIVFFKRIELLYTSAKNNSTNQKEFAQYLNKNVNKKYHNFLYRMNLDGDVMPMIKDNIYRNYLEHEGEIEQWKNFRTLTN